MNADGSISTADKTNVSLSGASDIQDNFKAEQIIKDATGKITASDITDTIKDGGVTLVPKNQSNTAGTLVFKNQIDTSQPFTINISLPLKMNRRMAVAVMAVDSGLFCNR